MANCVHAHVCVCYARQEPHCVLTYFLLRTLNKM